MLFWKLSLMLFDVSWVLPYMVKDVNLGRHGGYLGKKSNKAWRLFILDYLVGEQLKNFGEVASIVKEFFYWDIIVSSCGLGGSH